jgi:hypothetical protein
LYIASTSRNENGQIVQYGLWNNKYFAYRTVMK